MTTEAWCSEQKLDMYMNMLFGRSNWHLGDTLHQMLALFIGEMMTKQGKKAEPYQSYVQIIHFHPTCWMDKMFEIET
jgi:hypothetical protein